MTISSLKILLDYGLKVKQKPEFFVKLDIDTSANFDFWDVLLYKSWPLLSSVIYNVSYRIVNQLTEVHNIKMILRNLLYLMKKVVYKACDLTNYFNLKKGKIMNIKRMLIYLFDDLKRPIFLLICNRGNRTFIYNSITSSNVTMDPFKKLSAAFSNLTKQMWIGTDTRYLDHIYFKELMELLEKACVVIINSF